MGASSKVLPTIAGQFPRVRPLNQVAELSRMSVRAYAMSRCGLLSVVRMGSQMPADEPTLAGGEDIPIEE
jgi:hypothetical protein